MRLPSAVVIILCLFTSLADVSWTENWDPATSCAKVTQLFRAKNKITRKLNNVLKNKEDRKGGVHVNMIQIYREELDYTVVAFFDALDGMRKLIREDYKSVVKIKNAIQQRLDALKAITLRQEEQYNAISEAEKAVINANNREGKSNGSLIRQLIDDVWADVSVAADKLEEEINDKTFEQMKDAKGASIEAVVRLDEEGKPLNMTSDSQSESVADNGNEMGVLVDSQSNQFVLAKAKDSTVPHEDLNFIKDIIVIVLLSFIWSWLCSLIHLPTMFGFVISGMLLGPSGLNIIKSVVQVETLGEFGVFFILFTVGLEFSPDRIKKVWKVAVGGSMLMMLLTIMFGLFWGTCFRIIPQQSAFIASCLSLSSTPLVAKFVEGKHADRGKAHSNGDNDYTSSLLGILVMQDVQLGLLVALLPTLAGHQSPERQTMQGMLHDKVANGATDGFGHTMWIICDVVLAMFALFILYLFIAKLVIGYFYRLLLTIGVEELVFFGTVSIVFSMLMITEQLGISMELGCFVAGVVISSRGEGLVKQVMSLVSPMRDFFSCLFFASIGLHVFPTFVVNEFSIIFTLTLGVVIMKFSVAVFVLRLFLSENHSVKYIVAAGLAQVSEFSFVLGSRARRFHLISREVYLIILSVTTLTLSLAPLLWRLSLWRFGGEKLGMSSTSRQQKKPI